MRNAVRLVLLVLIQLCAVALLSAQYSLQLLQRFPENSAGKNNQAKFADVDGDGLQDLIASYSAGGTTGQVVGIWLNRGTKFSDSVDVTINLAFRAKQCWFNVGDVNGDSLADIVTTSQWASFNAPKIVYGRSIWPKLVSSPDVVCQFPVDPDWASGSQYTSITIGDFDADGFNDILFPDQGTKIEANDFGGRMIMYKGGATMTGVPDLVFAYPGTSRGFFLHPENPMDSSLIFLRWYSPFTSKGDFNADGIEDIFTGAYYSSTTDSLHSVVSNKDIQIWNTGAGVVYLGGSDLDTIPDVIMVPPDEFLQYSSTTDYMMAGYWVYNAGDINGDLADELSLPSWYWAVGFIYEGIPGIPQVPSEYQTMIVRDPFFYFTKNRYNNLGFSDQAGANLIPTGDINGDGTPDLGNNANFYGSGPDDPAIRLFFGKASNAGAVDPDLTSTDYMQVQASNIDFDGDGRADLVLSDIDSRLCLVKLDIASSVGQEWEQSKPEEFQLAQNYPNPFNPATKISYFVPQRSMVNLAVFNNLGQRVATLVNEEMGQGAHEVSFDAAKLASGNYFYRLTAGGTTQTRMMTIIR